MSPLGSLKLYKAPFRVHMLRKLCKLLGPPAGIMPIIRWMVLRLLVALNPSRHSRWQVHPRQVLSPLELRLGSSDIDAFHQIYILEEYRCLRNLENVSLVFDCGANVGFASAYFLSCFPKARVVAVEPDERN